MSKRLCGTSRLAAIPFIALLALCDASTAPTPDSSVPAMPDPGYTAYVDDITTDAVSVPTGGAEAIFIADSDRSTYVNLWTGTSLVSAVNARVAQGYPIGGTSAGLAVHGTYVYAALNASSVSSTVMANPYDVSVTLQSALFLVPLLRNMLTDSHSETRDRMERLTTFMARLQQDGLTAPSTSPRAIGVDEQSGVGVSMNRSAVVFGPGAGAFLLNATSASTGQTFSFETWTGPATTSYTPSITSGMLSSSTASIY